MAGTAETLAATLSGVLGDKIKTSTIALDEVTVVIAADTMIETFTTLRDHADLRFDMLADVCGVDYRDYGGAVWQGPRYAAVYHFRSLPHNRRLRVRVFAPDDDFPVLTSVVGMLRQVGRRKAVRAEKRQRRNDGAEKIRGKPRAIRRVSVNLRRAHAREF